MSLRGKSSGGSYNCCCLSVQKYTVYEIFQLLQKQETLPCAYCVVVGVVLYVRWLDTQTWSESGDKGVGVLPLE